MQLGVANDSGVVLLPMFRRDKHQLHAAVIDTAGY